MLGTRAGFDRGLVYTRYTFTPSSLINKKKQTRHAITPSKIETIRRRIRPLKRDYVPAAVDNDLCVRRPCVVLIIIIIIITVGDRGDYVSRGFFLLQRS